MNDFINKAKEQVNIKLKDHEKRLKHVYGVAETASKLGSIYGVDTNKLEIAGLYHDIAKFDAFSDQYLTDIELMDVMECFDIFHAYQAAYLIQKDLHVYDDDIIMAIRSHVYGHPDMSIYEKIIFVSDYCEPNRPFEDKDKIYDMATKNLDETIVYCLNITINDLISRNLQPSKMQLETYKYYNGGKPWKKLI